ncbi:MAG: glycosyltransferase family 39 protein [Patescibacteria group bacterium]
MKLLRLLQTNFNAKRQAMLILILICLLFLATRLYKIDKIPASVYWDEASIGYNAYSVLQTGRDEWGEFIPLHFRAFGEFKLPVYIYSVVFTESIFGLTPFAVRLPSVIYGLLSVIGLYLVVLKLTNKKLLSLLSSFLFSISPWFFIFSRTGYEATAGLAFFIWAIYLIIRNKLILATLLFIGSAYSYNSFRILTPLLLSPVLIYYFFKKEFKIIAVSIVILLASVFPLYKLYKQDSGLSRLQTVGSKNIVQNYIKNFSPDFLFITGDTNPRSQMLNTGQLYYLDAIFLVLGIIYILKKKDRKLYYILAILLLAPIPTSITKENPHALRSILMSPIMSVISAIGIYYLSNFFKKQKQLIFVTVLVLYSLCFENYMYKFATQYNNLSSSSWQIEYKQIFQKQKSGCVSDEFAQPYIFALFYGVDDEMNKVDPNYFIASRVLNPVSDWGFSTVASFGNYTFPKLCQTK